MSPSQFARVPGFVGSPLAAMNSKLLQGRVGQMLPPAPGFRAFFGAPAPTTPPPPQQHPPGPGPHLQNLRYICTVNCCQPGLLIFCHLKVLTIATILQVFQDLHVAYLKMLFGPTSCQTLKCLTVSRLGYESLFT